MQIYGYVQITPEQIYTYTKTIADKASVRLVHGDLCNVRAKVLCAFIKRGSSHI